MTKLLFFLAAAVTLAIIFRGPRTTYEEHEERRRKTQEQRPVLRICADPNNLPFSNSRGEGFENRLADLMGRDLGAEIQYYWWAQHRGHIRNTLTAGRCDVIPGLASTTERALTTTPYYRSTYVFVTRGDRDLSIGSFDSPVLRRLRIGVHLVGDDGANTPPVHALQLRNLAANLRGFSLTGDYTRENPPARLLEAVVDGQVDVAVAWGPLAGYFARRRSLPVRIAPVSPADPQHFPPMAYEISMGVRRQDRALRDRLDSFLLRRRADVIRVLDDYGIPRVDARGQLIGEETL